MFSFEQGSVNRKKVLRLYREEGLACPAYGRIHKRGNKF